MLHGVADGFVIW